MGMSWGQVAAAGLVGGIAGAADAGYKDIIQRERDEAEKLREQQRALLSRQTHAANAAVDAKIALDKIGPEADAKAAAAIRNVEATRAGAEAVSKGTHQGEVDVKGIVTPEGSERNMPDGTKYKVERTKAEMDADLKAASLAQSAAATDASRALAEERRAKAAGTSNAQEKMLEPKWGKKGTDGWEVDSKTGYRRREVDAVEDEPAREGVIDKVMGRSAPAKKGSPAKTEYAAPDGTPVSYEQFMEVLSKGQKGAAAQATATAGGGGKSVSATVPSRESSGKIGSAGRIAVRTGRDRKTGKRVTQYSDGSIEME